MKFSYLHIDNTYVSLSVCVCVCTRVCCCCSCCCCFSLSLSLSLMVSLSFVSVFNLPPFPLTLPCILTHTLIRSFSPLMYSRFIHSFTTRCSLATSLVPSELHGAAAIDWSVVHAGDTLYVCGLHDNGRVDGALNLTLTVGNRNDLLCSTLHCDPTSSAHVHVWTPCFTCA